MSRRGFTLIELLVVIGILIVLSAMVLLAMRSVTGGAKSNATHVALDNCRSLLTEYDTGKRMNESNQNWGWLGSGGPQFVTGDPTTLQGPNFWLRPGVGGALEPLDAPGYVKDDSVGHEERNASRAVVNTTVAMGALASIPANREAILKLPQDQVMVPEWISAQFTSAGADRFRGTNDELLTDKAHYPVGSRVRSNGANYRCVTNHVAAGAGPTNASPWSIDASPIPILKDGWGNPIIFVPATGLNVRLLRDKKELNTTDVTQNQTIKAPDNRPFWASAGPDGDFSKGDDNIYSFEH